MGASHAGSLDGNALWASSGDRHIDGFQQYPGLFSLSCAAAMTAPSACRAVCAECGEATDGPGVSGDAICKNVEEELLITPLPLFVLGSLSSTSTAASSMDNCNSDRAGIGTPRLVLSTPYMPVESNYDNVSSMPYSSTAVATPSRDAPPAVGEIMGFSSPSPWPSLEPPLPIPEPPLESSVVNEGPVPAPPIPEGMPTAHPSDIGGPATPRLKQRKEEHSPYRGGVLSLFTPTPPRSPPMLPCPSPFAPSLEDRGPSNFLEAEPATACDLDGDQQPPQGTIALGADTEEEERQLRLAIERSLKEYYGGRGASQAFQAQNSPPTAWTQPLSSTCGLGSLRRPSTPRAIGFEERTMVQT